MIKSLETGNNNAYRILKVLTNQDYLAIDSFSNYYILSPTITKQKLDRINQTTKKKLSQLTKTDYHIIQPLQIIEIDSISYSVFGIKASQVVFLRNMDHKKQNNDILIADLFSDSILAILQHLLLYRSKDIKRYINSKNFVVIGSRLYLILASRQKLFRVSLKRSQRSQSKSPQSRCQNTLNNYLNNQIEIIRQFGLVIWECFHQKCYPFTQQKNKFIKVTTVIKEMVNQKITYQFLTMKISELKVSKRKSYKKIPLSSKRQRLMTQFCQNTHKVHRKVLKSLDFDKQVNFQTQNLSFKNKTPLATQKPKLSVQKRIFTTNTDYEMNKYHYHSQKSKFILVHEDQPETTLLPRQTFRKKRLERNNRQKQRYKDWLGNHKFQTSFRERIKKQSEIARQKFRKSVQSNYAEEDTRSIIDQGSLKEKLMLKLKTIKTSLKDSIKEFSSLSNGQRLNQQTRQQTSQQDRLFFHNRQVQKKLVYSSIHKKYNQHNLLQNENEINNKNIDQQFEQIKIIQLENENKEMYVIKQKVLETNQKLCFEKIDETCFLQTNSQIKVFSFKDKNEKTDKLDKVVTEPVRKENTDLKKVQSLNQNAIKEETKVQNIEKTQVVQNQVKKQIQQVQNDQIEVINLGTKQKQGPAKQTINQINLQQKNNFIIETISPKVKAKAMAATTKIKYDSIDQCFHQYLTLINILGNVCVKTVKSKQKLQKLQWRKGIYFIYERFCCERQAIFKSLMIGACQLFRKNRKINYQEWQEWLKAPSQQQLRKKIQTENIKIRTDLNKFASNLQQASPISRKADYYVRNRQKTLQSCDKTVRMILSKFAVDEVIDLYNCISQTDLYQPDQLKFIWDCLYALKIIAQLDNLLEQNKYVDINKYQKYTNTPNELTEQLQSIYSLYFAKQKQKNPQVQIV